MALSEAVGKNSLDGVLTKVTGKPQRWIYFPPRRACEFFGVFFFLFFSFLILSSFRECHFPLPILHTHTHFGTRTHTHMYTQTWPAAHHFLLPCLSWPCSRTAWVPPERVNLSRSCSSCWTQHWLVQSPLRSRASAFVDWQRLDRTGTRLRGWGHGAPAPPAGRAQLLQVPGLPGAPPPTLPFASPLT